MNAYAWNKSSRSAGNGGECVELGRSGAAQAIRDSKNQAGPMLNVSHALLLEDVRAGRLG